MIALQNRPSLDIMDPKSSHNRGNLPAEVTDILKSWFRGHKDHPYPSEKEKQLLGTRTGLRISQVTNWFINARRRFVRSSKKTINDGHASKVPRPRSAYEFSRQQRAETEINGPDEPQTRSPSPILSSQDLAYLNSLTAGVSFSPSPDIPAVFRQSPGGELNNPRSVKRTISDDISSENSQTGRKLHVLRLYEKRRAKANRQSVSTGIARRNTRTEKGNKKRIKSSHHPTVQHSKS